VAIMPAGFLFRKPFAFTNHGHNFRGIIIHLSMGRPAKSYGELLSLP
jgi:hypothetical protein